MPPAKRRKLSPPKEGERATTRVAAGSGGSMSSSFASRAAQWDLEQDFENQPRSMKDKQQTTRLPIKTSEGVVQRSEPADDEDQYQSDSSSERLDQDTPSTEIDPEEKPKISPREEILQAQEELARIASLINEAPEEHVGGLRQLAYITSSRNAVVTKLGLVTQCAVYKDVIPGYRIRPIAEQDQAGKVSKEVRRHRQFEQSIVGGYQKYIQELARIAFLPNPSADTASMANTAVKCACDLLSSVPHFNFRGDLLKVLVDKLARKGVDEDFIACREALEKLFQEDEEGNASYEAVTMLSRMIKGKHFRVNESVLNTFLHLRLLSEFSHKASHERIDRDQNDRKPVSNKDMKKHKQRLSKKDKKLEKERKEIEKEMEEADATVSYEHRDQRQGETLKLVLGVYFRILKAHVQHLMGAVLEGLVKYAHLINQDLFGDILEAMRDLVEEIEAPPEDDEEGEVDNTQELEQGPRNVARESLLCVITAFALLQGQDASKAASTLHLDLDFFITHLYRNLYPAALNADIELGNKTVHLPGPDGAQAAPRSRVNVQTTVVLLLRGLQAVLLPANARGVPPIRLAAFVKQILTSSVQMPEKSCVAMLGLLNQVSKVHKKRIAALWNTEERKGDGVFDPLRAQVEGSNPFATNIWEGELLRLHYSPDVREGVKNLESSIAEVGS